MLKTDEDGPYLDCPYCGGKARRESSEKIYGVDHGLVFLCENYPECDSYVGTHKSTGKPLGTLADKELRRWRKRAHGVFDELWRNWGMLRTDAYKLLAGWLQVQNGRAHIGKSSRDQCQTIIRNASFHIIELTNRRARAGKRREEKRRDEV